MLRLGFIFSFTFGRMLFLGLWTAGLGALAAMATGLLPASVLFVGAVLLLLMVTVAVGVMSQGSGFFARPLNRVAGAREELALTFDDGPDPEVTPVILELLAAAGQRATFFVLGSRIARHPELAARIARDGHELGNHSYDHRWHMALWAPRRIAADLQRTNDIIEAAAGQRPRHFRPPAAALSPRIAAAANRAGLSLVGYSVRSGDGSPLVPPRVALRRLLRGMGPGAVLLLHDARPGAGVPSAAVELLPELLTELSARGLRSVPLGELVDSVAARAHLCKMQLRD